MKAVMPTKQVTDRQLLEAEEGLVRLLHAKRFPREWIERHVPEVMAQARTDFAVRLAAGRDDETVNLLVVIGYRRALKVLRSQKTSPATTSLETVFHLADESTPTPEEEAIEHDREVRVTKAMGHLPERERELLMLVYFKGLSIRAAGRRLGWGKSAVDRHHQAALERLKAMLDKSLLSPHIPIPAFITARHRPLRRVVMSWLEGAAETIRNAAMLRGSRVGSVAETGSAAVASGGGRTAAGLCGAAVVACLAGAATGAVGPGVRPVGVDDSHRVEALPRVRETSTALPSGNGQPTAPVSPSTPRAEDPRISKRGREAPEALARPPERRDRSGAIPAPKASMKQTIDEFGIEDRGAEEPAVSSGEAQPIENLPVAPESSPPARPPAEPSGGSSPGSQRSSEFGL